MSGWVQKRSIKRRYDSTAETYDVRYAEEQEAKYAAALADVKLEGLILDVGCGTGLSFCHISPKTKDIVGVDLSKELLLQARKRAKTSGGVGLVQADADHLPFRDNEFETIFAFTVLQNMPKPLETLMEFRRKARVGSAIIVTGLKKKFSMEDLKELLDLAGLQVISIKDEEKLKCYIALSVKRA